MSLPSSGTVDWKDFLKGVESNPFLQEESTDTSLQPGEQYPIAPHPYMVGCEKQKDATMNQITTLLQTKPSEVPVESRPAFIVSRDKTKAKWLYPFTVENPSGTQNYAHWLTQFNNAVVQIVSTQL